MKICVATILDNLANPGCLVQATSMLRMFAAEGIVWKREKVWESFSRPVSSTIKDHYFSQNISRSFTDHREAAEYINSNFDLMIVGSDELWKAGDESEMFSLPYPNPYWGTGIHIRKLALAVSTGSVDFSTYAPEILKKMHDDLSSFELIYVRDRKSAGDLEKIGIRADGILPDPTFAIDFEPTDKLPTDDVNPEEWFASFANLEFCELERMHKLLACIRGGTPCRSLDPRSKSKEIVNDFNLPSGSEEYIKRNWPFKEIAKRCDAYKARWKELVDDLCPDSSLPLSKLTKPIIRYQQASTTYLFDKQRSGRLLNKKGELTKPIELWSFRLPNDPPCSPESTAVFDESGNMYFGCHDGKFYSLDHTGKLRWSFETTGKIYSSPLLYPDSTGVCVASGDGHLYSFNLEGELLWKHLIGTPVSTWYAKKLQQYHKTHSPALHEINRIASANSWASPNMLADGTVCISGYSLGLSAIDHCNGRLKWRVNLGKPAAHLSGVAIAEDESIFAVAQQGSLFKISREGAIIWKRSLMMGFNAWGNPSIDQENETVYVPVSRREEQALVYAFDFEGKLIWRSRLREGTRGAVSISREKYVLCCGFKGNLYFLDKDTGAISDKIKVTDGKLWTSCSIDPNGYIFISLIDSSEQGTGRVCCYDRHGNFVWDHDIGKGHSVPIIDEHARLYAGSWRGEYICLQT